MFHRLGLIFILSDGRNIDLRTYLSTWPRGGITKEVFGDVDEYIQVNIRKRFFYITINLTIRKTDLDN